MFTEFTVAIDKYDKVGVDGVVEELINRGFDDSVCNGVKQLFEANSSGSNYNVIKEMKSLHWR